MFHIMVPNMIKMPFCCIKNALFYQVPLNVLEIEKVSKLRDYQHFSSRDGSTGRGSYPPLPNAWKKDMSWSKDNNQLVKMWL